MKRIAIPCLIVLLSFCSNSGYGQIKAVLVKLYSEQNRIAHFQRKGDVENVNYIKKDAAATMKATVGDFEANFHYCNVYYFIDTNLNEIIASNFTGILLNENLEPASNSVLKNGDTSFVIVYFGIPDDEEHDKRDGRLYRSVWYPNDGLVLLGHDYKRMKYFDYFLWHRRLPSKEDKKYTYFSKRFGIGYKPFAKLLQDELSGRRSRYFEEQKGIR